MEDRRLLTATEAAFGSWVANYGFRIEGTTARGRGNTSTVRSDLLLLRILHDSLEGEIVITVDRPGRPPVDLEQWVDLSAVSGLGLTRLPKGITSGQLESRLRKVADAIEAREPDLVGRAADPTPTVRP